MTLRFSLTSHPSRHGFTLVELSIVLVILGLLIGGVLTGQSLIRAAELRSVSTQYSRYTAAIQTFRDKYFALPGDMVNAQSYWGTATCDLTTPSTDAKTCNGDGNGSVAFNSSTTTNESFRFWQHLANAGLIEGNYDGIAHGTNPQSATNVNSPSGRMASSLWMAIDFGTASGGGNFMFDNVIGNSLEFGAYVINSTNGGVIVKPEEAYNIDTKMDDGKPATGKLIMRGILANCTDSGTSSNLAANYLLTNTALACALVFRQQF